MASLKHSSGLGSDLLTPELIHPFENVWVLCLQFVPKPKIGHRDLFRKEGLISSLGRWILEFEAQESQAEVFKNPFELRKREAMLLNVKQEVAAVAHRVKVRPRWNSSIGIVVGKPENALPEAPDRIF